MKKNVRELSAEDSALDAFCMVNQTRLWLLEEALDGMADDTLGKPEIERRLKRLRAAFRARNLDAAEGWLYATLDGIKAIGTWLPKTKGKIKQEETLKGVRAAGTAATKAAAEQRQEVIERAVKANPGWAPKRFCGMAAELGLSEETVIEKVRAIRRKGKN